MSPGAPAPLPALNPAWVAHRQALHATFEQACRPPDASWLGHVGMPDERWSLEQVADLWRHVPAQPGAVAAVNHVYVHVPFCKSICSFCNYERLRPTHPDLLRRWRDRVIHALETLAPALQAHTFHSLYVGGGTPSVLPAPIVREVLHALDTHLRFSPHARRAFELDPAVLSEDRLKAWADGGFSRASFGVQTLSAEVNAAHDRGAQGPGLVERRFGELRDAGISEVSVDFLLGLAGTTPGALFAEIERTIEAHRPRWVDVFLLTPTQAYLESHFGGSQEAFWDHLRPFQEAARPRLAEIARRTGYSLQGGDGHHHSLQDNASQAGVDGPVNDRGFTYCQSVAEQRRPLSLLGLGTSARSRLFGQAWVEFRDPGDDVGAEGPAWFRGPRAALADEAREYLIFTLRDGSRVSRWEVEALFGRPLEALFGRALAAWAQLGLGELGPRALTLPEADRTARARALLWLVPGDRLEWEIARHQGLPVEQERLSAALGRGEDARWPHPSWPVARVSPARVHLAGPCGEATVRVAPEIGPDACPGRPRLVLETPPPAPGPARAALKQALATLRRALETGRSSRLQSGSRPQ